MCKCQFSSGFSHMFDDTRGCSKKAKQNTKKCEILLRRLKKNIIQYLLSIYIYIHYVFGRVIYLFSKVFPAEFVGAVFWQFVRCLATFSKTEGQLRPSDFHGKRHRGMAQKSGTSKGKTWGVVSQQKDEFMRFHSTF